MSSKNKRMFTRDTTHEPANFTNEFLGELWLTKFSNTTTINMADCGLTRYISGEGIASDPKVNKRDRKINWSAHLVNNKNKSAKRYCF